MNFCAHLVESVRKNWPECSRTVEPPSKSAANSSLDRCRTVVLHFDHMRSRSSYSKTIEHWTCELGITGRLVFCDRLIVALMQGAAADIKVGF